jgi:hypothetical protein
MRKVLIAAFVGLLMPTGIAEAQWLNYPDPRIPRSADGKPILTAPAPRTADGKPDLSGVWHVQSEPVEIKLQRLGPPPKGVGTVIGMEADTVSMYGLDVTLDYKPGVRHDVRSSGSIRASTKRARIRTDDVLPTGGDAHCDAWV